MLTCDWCGREAASESEEPTWTRSVEGGRRRAFCPACSRDHLRAIEGKLDAEWW